MLRPNKITFDYTQDEAGVPHSMWVILEDEKVATQVSKEEFFAKSMFSGCFVERKFFPTREEANSQALGEARSIGCSFVTPRAFREIEARGQAKRAKLALAEAEKRIRRS